MITKATVRISETTLNFNEFNRLNEAASQKISLKYNDLCRITAFKRDKDELELMMFIDYKYLTELDSEKFTKEYLLEIGIQGDLLNSTEVTHREFWRPLRSLANELALRNGTDEVFRFNWDSETWSDIVYNEHIRQFEEKVISKNMTGNHGLFKPKIDEELGRIRQNKNPTFIGHPVHYLVQGTQINTSLDISFDLVRALNENKRLCSYRVNLAGYNNQDFEIDQSDFETVMNITVGSTLVVDLRQSNSQGNNPKETNNSLELISTLFKKYCHKILFIFLFEEKKDPIISGFLERVEDVSFVIIEPELMNAERANEFIINRALEHHADPSYFENLLDSGQVLFNESEVMDLFRKKHSALMKSDYFPEYGDVAFNEVNSIREPKGKAYNDLQALIGLENVKLLLEQFLSYQKALPALKEFGLKVENQNRHMVFTGTPGTAKTTVARLLGQILRDNGLLSEGGFIEAGRSNIVGEYVGWTAMKVRKLFKKAKGSILFIDEAYSLNDGYENSFANEAIATIVQEMENMREDLIVIFAGYPKEMNGFVQKNPGLKSRISFIVDFKDYSVDELVDIAELMIEEKGFIAKRDVYLHIKNLCLQAKTDENFGNGRFIRNLVEEAIMVHIDRIYRKNHTKPTESEVKLLVVEDFRKMSESTTDYQPSATAKAVS